MTVIHGDILKIYEIEKDAYSQRVVGGRFIDAYSFAFIIAPGTSFFNIASPPWVWEILQLNSINITCQDTANIQRIYFVLYPAGIVLGDFYFYFSYTPRQFFLGDIQVDITSGNYISIYFENNAGGNRYFEGSIWYMGLAP